MGTTTSCGCFFYESHVKDLTGQRFGRLTVLRQEGRNKQGHLKWICRCDCGTEKAIVGASLVKGAVVSCGCYHREQASTTEFEDLTNHTFGKLAVLGQAPSRVVHDKRGSYKKRVWRCACECGAIVEVPENSLKTGHTNSCGCYRIERVVEAVSGEKNHNWRDGATPLRAMIRNSSKYNHWRNAVFERDHYTCQFSKLRGGKLHVHHIKPFDAILTENGVASWEAALACAELWDINNGITLSIRWHSNRFDGSFHSIYGNWATETDFFEWFKTAPYSVSEVG
jgi:hypothetical protein